MVNILFIWAWKKKYLLGLAYIIFMSNQPHIKKHVRGLLSPS